MARGNNLHPIIQSIALRLTINPILNPTKYIRIIPAKNTAKSFKAPFIGNSSSGSVTWSISSASITSVFSKSFVK